ncbi:MAG TPA: hypothetical protein VI819_03495 [Patescibacteria group bacterium]|nr:hypothetical protein [Patescibacteria group bacterium]
MYSIPRIIGKIFSVNSSVGKEITRFNESLVSFFVKYQKPIYFLFVIFIVLTFVTKAQIFLDPDFGWRLRNGQYILNNGFTFTDPFSYTMPSYPFVDHAWLVSLFIGLTYPVFGKTLLTVVTVTALVAAIIIAFRTGNPLRLRKFSIRPTSGLWLFGHPLVILALAILLPFFSIRAQIATWLMFSGVLYLTSSKAIFEKYKYFLPLTFLLWANLHGGYALGLFVLYYTIFIEFVRDFSSGRKLLNKKNLTNLFILILSTGVILVNPYGIGSVKEVYSSISDSSLRFKIAEWLPSLTYFDLSVAFYLAIVSITVFLKRKSLAIEKLILFFIIFLFALSSRRNFPFWVLYSLPISADLIRELYEDYSKKTFVKARFWVVYKYFLVIAVGIFLFQSIFSVWRVLLPTDEGGYYPVEAVAILKNNLPGGEIFSSYGWGGYLIWQLPQKRVFVDGRMPSWRFNPPNNHESSSAFDDYNAIKDGKLNFSEVSEKYGIDTVLWPKEEETSLNYIEKVVRKLVKADEQKFNFIDSLKKSGWVLVHEDKEAQIYKKPGLERI